MDAAVVQRQVRLDFRVLLRDGLDAVADVPERRLETRDDRGQERRLPEADLRLFDPGRRLLIDRSWEDLTAKDAKKTQKS